MPEPGDVVRGADIGKPASNAHRYYIWIVCACGAGRWLQRGLKAPENCFKCHRKKKSSAFMINPIKTMEYRDAQR